MQQIKLISLFCLIFVTTAQAAIDVYKFEDEEQHNRFKILTEELRCPKCQNQNIADSNAEIAKDISNKIQLMIVEDKSNDEIVQYMVDRYGDFVLYEPRVDTQTYLLWFGPLILLLLAFVIVFFIVRLRGKRSSIMTLDSEQQQKLDDLLKK